MDTVANKKSCTNWTCFWLGGFLGGRGIRGVMRAEAQEGGLKDFLEEVGVCAFESVITRIRDYGD